MAHRPLTTSAHRPLTLVVAAVLATRVLGLSLVLPGFTAHGLALGGDLVLVGLAFGAYALSQAVLQVPMGALSDRLGRRGVLAAGLAVSALGSFMAAWAPTVELLLVARLVQGAGAVNGVALALLGERAPTERRTTALAVAGAAIGVGFTAGLVAGGLLGPVVGVPGLFALNGVLVLATLAAALAWVPASPAESRSAGFRDVAAALAARPVLALAAAAFATNLALHAVLFLFPLAPVPPDVAQRALAGVVVAGGLVMFLGARQADRGRARAVGAAAALALAAGAAGVALARSLGALLATGALFFAGQSVLAALVPSLVARDAPAGGRGAAQSGVALAGYAGVVLGPLAAAALVAARPALAALLAAVGAVAAALLARRATPRE